MYLRVTVCSIEIITKAELSLWGYVLAMDQCQKELASHQSEL